MNQHLSTYLNSGARMIWILSTFLFPMILNASLTRPHILCQYSLYDVPRIGSWKRYHYKWWSRELKIKSLHLNLLFEKNLLFKTFKIPPKQPNNEKELIRVLIKQENESSVIYMQITQLSGVINEMFLWEAQSTRFLRSGIFVFWSIF